VILIKNMWLNLFFDMPWRHHWFQIDPWLHHQCITC